MAIQVNSATKNGSGQPLPISQRQFISFSYGGKNIEDFDLLAVFSDRLEKEIYSSFNDIVSSNDIIEGQMFWASIFKTGRLKFTLATDGMSSENYELFKQWFAPGDLKELVLSEFSNRYILARVSTPPQISLIPFEDKKTIRIPTKKKDQYMVDIETAVEYEFSTTLYKGEITLEFIMDEPHWFSKTSYIEGDLDKDTVKIIYEDKLPFLTMLPATGDEIYLLADSTKIKNREKVTDSINSSNNTYIYNCGTAPANTILSFTLTPTFNSDGFVSTPANFYAPAGDKKYSSFYLDGQEVFNFSTPSILTSYNYAIKMIKEITSGDSIIEFRQRARDELHNYYTRAWLISAVDVIRQNRPSGALETNDKNSLLTHMSKFLKPDGGTTATNFTFTIDSKMGTVFLETSCRVATRSAYSPETGAVVDGSFVAVVENAGDIVKSKYLKIDGRDSWQKKGTFSDNSLITKENCLKLSSDFNFTNLSIDFKYTYL